MPSCPKCDQYSDPSIDTCPSCSTKIQFPLEYLIQRFDGNIPNILSTLGFKISYPKDGFSYFAIVEPQKINKGDIVILKIFMQSFYKGVSNISIDIQHRKFLQVPKSNFFEAIKPETLTTKLSPLEAAIVSIPIETDHTTKKGQQFLRYFLRCTPEKGVQKIETPKKPHMAENMTEKLTEKIVHESVNFVLHSAIEAALSHTGVHIHSIPNVLSDSGGPTNEFYFEIFDKTVPIKKAEQKLIHKTIFPVFNDSNSKIIS